MNSIKLLLYQLRFHKLFASLISPLQKAIYFLKFSNWVSEQNDLALNDFPVKDSVYKRRYKVYEFVKTNEIKDEAVNYLEFGVADGETFYWWLAQLKNADTRFYGFDTFTGLPETWGKYEKGTFSEGGNIPVLNDTRGKFFKGLFQETLYDFLKTFDATKKNIILLDADLYSSTLFVLTTIAPFLKNNDIIMFDEFSAPQHEYLAYVHFSSAYPKIVLHPIAAMNNFSFVAFRVALI